MVRAVLEGIAFRSAEALRAVTAGLPESRLISIDGGMAQNPYFVQFLADVSGRTIRIPDQEELTAIGAASLAAHGIGSETSARFRSETICEPKETDGAPWSARFDDALARSRNWR